MPGRQSEVNLLRSQLRFAEASVVAETRRLVGIEPGTARHRAAVAKVAAAKERREFCRRALAEHENTGGVTGMPIQDVAGALAAAKKLADEAWDTGGQAQDKASKALEALTAIAGPNPPHTLGAAITALTGGRQNFQDGRAAMTGAEDLVDEYLGLLNG
jgi:hypothetical protein